MPALPDGWTNINTTNHGTNIYNRTCYKIAGASEGTVGIADSGVYTVARAFTFSGVDTTNPINVSGTNTDDGTSFSATGVTTTVDNCMVVHAVTFQDAGAATDTSNYGTPSNANLAELTERSDNYAFASSTINGGIYLVTGIKAAAGATGNTTSTSDSANNYSAVVTFALTPATTGLRPDFHSIGAVSYGTGAITAAVPANYAAGDLLVLAIVGRDALPALPGGWTNINTANNSTNIYVRACYKIATASESNVNIADSGVYTLSGILLVKNNNTTSPINVSTTSTDSGTTFVAGGVTTTVDNCLIIHATGFQDAGTSTDTTNFSSQSNANLYALAERSDAHYYGSAAGVLGGLYILTGTKVSAGATGNTTATSDSANNYAATVTFAIAPPSEAAEVPEGGSESTVIVSVQGSGLSIRQGGASSSVVVSAQGAGIAIRLGSASSTVIVSVQGAGAKIGSGGSSPTVVISAEGDGEVIVTIAEGGSEATVTVSSDGAGSKTGLGSSDVTVTVSDEGSGIKVSLSGSDSSIIVSSEGSGTKTGTGSSDSTVLIGTQGSGTKSTSGSSESPITISVQGIGKKISSSGSDSTVIIDVQGSGIRVMSGGSETSVEVSSDGSGIAIRLGGSDSTVVVSAQGGGYGTLKTGGANSTVIIGIQGNGSKLTSGSSESMVIIIPQGRGRTYKPIIITAIFNYEAEVDAVFDYSAEVGAVFNYEAEKVATFNYEAEQTAIFNPALTIGGTYGDS